MNKGCILRSVWLPGCLLSLGLLLTGCGSTGVTSSANPGNPAGALNASQSSLQFGNVPTGTAATQVLTFSNPTGGQTVTVSSVQVNGAGFSITPPPTLPLTVAAGQSASITLQALPSASGPMTGTLTVVSNASPSTIVINLSATGVTPTGTTFSISGQITPASLVLGATVTLSGGSAPTTVTVDSTGNFTFLAVSNGTYMLTPAGGSLTFAPASQQITVNNANVSGVNFAVTFSISGLLGTAGSGATVTLSGPVSATTTADSSGNFSFSGLANGIYTITPTKSGVTFTPASRQVTINNASVSGSSLSFTETFSISGTISPAAAASGTNVSLSGTASQQVTVDANGNFIFNGVANGSYTVTPTKQSTSFAPANQQVTVSNASISGLSFTASGQLSINPSTFTFSNVSVGTTSQPQTATLSASAGDVTISSDVLTGSGFGLSGITFPITIKSGTSTSAFITFTPNTVGPSSGTLSFDTGSTVLATANLSGSGAGLSTSPPTVNFGAVADGTSSPATVVTLTAVGAAVTVNSANLVQSGGGGIAFVVSGLPMSPFSIGAGQTLQLNVVFSPAAGSPGAASGTLTFSTSSNNVTETLSGTGQSNVLLTWTASTVPNVTYNVYRCSISSAACAQGQPGNFSLVATGIASLSYTDAGVSSGQTYYYALTSVDSTSTEGPLSTVTPGASIP